MVKRVKQPNRERVGWAFLVLVDSDNVPAHSLNVSEQFSVGIVLSYREFSFHRG